MLVAMSFAADDIATCAWALVVLFFGYCLLAYVFLLVSYERFLQIEDSKDKFSAGASVPLEPESTGVGMNI